MTHRPTSWITRALLEIQPAAHLGRGLAVEPVREPPPLALAGRERLHRPDVGDASTSSPPATPAWCGIAVVDRPAAGTDEGQTRHHDRDEDEERHRHPPVDGQEDDEGADELGAGRHDLQVRPSSAVPKATAGRGDPAAERAREMLREVAHRVAGQMLEQVEPDIDAGRRRWSGRRASRRRARARSRPRPGPGTGGSAGQTRRRCVGPPGHGVDQSLIAYCTSTAQEAAVTMTAKTNANCQSRLRNLMYDKGRGRGRKVGVPGPSLAHAATLRSIRSQCGREDAPAGGPALRPAARGRRAGPRASGWESRPTAQCRSSSQPG